MTKRRVERLLEQAKENGQSDGDPREVAVEVGAVPARGPEEGGPRRLADGERFEAFRLDLRTGEVETPDADDLDECAVPDCPNPSLPFEGEAVCEKCADMPRQDWRPVVRRNDEDRTGDDDE